MKEGGGGQSRSELGVFNSLEPEPFENKPGAWAAWKKSQEPEPHNLGAGAAQLKKIAGTLEESHDF